MNNLSFRKAKQEDQIIIWQIIANAIERRKKDGSTQWQNGYPNPETIKNDIQQEIGFVLENQHEIVAYCALILNDEPAYDSIEGEWLNNNDFYVIHRIAVHQDFLGKGFATKLMYKIEEFVLSQQIENIKVDTNYDNMSMLRVFEKLSYQYCGKVELRGAERLAFQKKITN